ncbi:MAG: hypothetical protein M3Y18_06395 [Candidatus Eremiobacteraeota bacterium]|nr:hypothetical protein [Candidatus Eremiobacteraeota bacterium]
MEGLLAARFRGFAPGAHNFLRAAGHFLARFFGSASHFFTGFLRATGNFFAGLLGAFSYFSSSFFGAARDLLASPGDLSLGSGCRFFDSTLFARPAFLAAGAFFCRHILRALPSR